MRFHSDPIGLAAPLAGPADILYGRADSLYGTWHPPFTATLSRSPLQGAGFPDLLGQLLLAEVDRLMLRGLFQDYQPVQQWLSSPRGKIDFAAIASRPIPTRVGLPCRYSPRVLELPLNQLVPAAIRSLLPCLRTGWLSSRLHQRERTWTDLCGASPLNLDLLQRAEASLDRRSRYYRPVLDLAWLIYRARSFGFAATEMANLPQMIFDMAALFERVVARLCQEYAPPGLRVEAQERNYQAYHWQSNPQNWRRPQLRPDLVVRDSLGKVCLILDTKYKDLDRKQFGPADLYQMTLYSLSYGSPVVVVYPASSAEKGGRLHFRSFQAESRSEIRFVGASLEHLAATVTTGNLSEIRLLVDTLLVITG